MPNVSTDAFIHEDDEVKVRVNGYSGNPTLKVGTEVTLYLKWSHLLPLAEALLNAHNKHTLDNEKED